jgi:hypothetical protein
MIGPAFRDALLTLDLAMLRRLWAHVAPGLPPPRDDEETLITAHHARVRAKTLPAKARAYSAAFLAERDMAMAEPIIVAAIGAASSASDRGLKAAIQDAMTRAAEAAMAAGYDPDTDAKEIRAAMLDARAKVKAGRISV